MEIYQFLLRDGLLQEGDRKKLLDYCERRLSKLEQYDRENATALQETVLAYYKNGFSVVNTAKAMGLHRNSLRYRIHKVRELLGLEPDDYMGYLELVNCLLVKKEMNRTF